jgi:hypothetical protein
MEKPVDSHELGEWGRSLYIEAWKQYIHEEKISLSRNNIFLGIQSGLMAVLSGLFVPIFQMKPILFLSRYVSVGPIIWGILAIILSSLSLFILKYWQDVTEVARAYQNLRWFTARAIEVQFGLEPVNIAGIEHEWRELSRGRQNNSKEIYLNFEQLEGMRQHKLPLYRKVGLAGWQSVLNLIKSIKTIWIVVFIIGSSVTLSFILGFIFS